MKVSIRLKELKWRDITGNKYFSIQTDPTTAKKNTQRNATNEIDLLSIQLI
jgi:hypothetical protein